MSLFKKHVDELPKSDRKSATIPQTELDLATRYDIYCSEGDFDRIYEDVQIKGIKTLSRDTDYPSIFEEFLEIETSDGTRMLIRTMSIDTMCHAGVAPVYRLAPRNPNAATKIKQAEQGDAVQPATAVDSKAEGGEKPYPESEARSQ